MTFSNIVGSIVRWKGIHVYLSAVNNIDCGNCSFELVGRKSDVEFEYYNFIMEKITVQIRKIDFIDDIKSYYEQIDVLVHTSIEPEPFGLVLLEGMAKGKVIIATDGGAVREVVDDSYGNIIVEPNNIKALQEAILQVSRYDRKQLDFIKEKNIELAKKKFCLKNQINEISQIYLNVMDKL